MKKLVIIRDAKSDDCKDTNIDDFDIPLNSEGIKNSSFVGEFLKNKNIFPDLIISSPALKAISTAEIIAKELHYKNAIIQNQYIYKAYVNTLQEIVSYINDGDDTVFLIGDNPGVSALAYMLCDLKQTLPSCATVEINFDVNSWMDVSKENSTLISYDFINEQ